MLPLLAAALALMLLVGIVSAYPVNEQVIDAETAAKEDETLWALQRAAEDADELPAVEELPVFALYAEAVPLVEDVAVPVWAVVLTEESGPLESFAEVVRDENGYSVDFKRINRKGRLHSSMLPVLDLGEGAYWRLSSGLPHTGQTAAAAQPVTPAMRTVRLYINNTDEGIYLLSCRSVLDEE